MPAPYYSDESVTLHHGGALAVLSTLPDRSVDCAVTSPPYLGLRDYGVPPSSWPAVTFTPVAGLPPLTVPAMDAACLGLESDPWAYVAHIVLIMREVRRVLTDDGTLWLNIGDSYNTWPSGDMNNGFNERWGNSPGKGKQGPDRALRRSSRPDPTMHAKNLLMIPSRTAGALQQDGWILRAENIWSKRNCMPEPVTDRTARSHEQLYLFSKLPRYWYDADAIREASDPEQEAHNERYAKVYPAQADRAAKTGQPGNANSAGIHSRPGKPGRNARSVWTISAQPFAEAHFATMPPALAERCIQAGCKPGGTVLDPFSGSGTTGLAAARHGRRYVGIDLNAEYLDLSLRTRLAQAGLPFGEVSA